MYSDYPTPLHYDLSTLPAELFLTKNTVCADSRQVQAGDIFLAYPGESADGRDYIAMAIERGAHAIIYHSDETFRLPENLSIPAWGLPHLNDLAGIVAAKLLQEPAKTMRIIGVTGTNGKTSITQWLQQAFDSLKHKTAVIGTIGNGTQGHISASDHTTPDAVEIQRLINGYAKENVDTLAIEVSSHGLMQARVHGLLFDTAVFTNLTRDHLDYHGTIEAYADAKKRLFYWHHLPYAVINQDDAYGKILAESLRRERPQTQVLSYGFDQSADVRITDFHESLDGITLTLKSTWGECHIHNPLLGRFNAQNLAALAAVLWLHHVTTAEIAKVLQSIKPARGRMQCLNQVHAPLVVVDYAHTPDALEKALTALRPLLKPSGKLWCIFGCGGNRDRGKRPLMGEVATRLADQVVVTSDNPRLENPLAIIEDIRPSLNDGAIIEPLRHQAIQYAVQHATAQDIILIAGKGHETYQDAGGIKQHFDDFEEAQQAIKQRLSLSSL